MKTSGFLKQLLAAVLAVQASLTVCPASVYAEESGEEEVTLETTEEKTAQETFFEEEEGTEVSEEPVKEPLQLTGADELTLEDGNVLVSVTPPEGFRLPLTFVFTDREFTVEAGENGEYVFSIPLEDLAPGENEVYVYFAGDEEYGPAELSIVITAEEVSEEIPEGEAYTEVQTEGYAVRFMTYVPLQEEEIPEQTPETNPDEPAEEITEEEPEETGEEETPEELPDFAESGVFSLEIPRTENPYHSIESVQYDSLLDDGTYQVGVKTTDASFTDFLFVTAEKDGVTWFLGMTDEPVVKNLLYTINVRFDLPAGEYKLHAGSLSGKSSVTVSANQYTLVVLDEPVITAKQDYEGTGLGYIDLDVSWFQYNPYLSYGFSNNKARLFVQHSGSYESASSVMSKVLNESDGSTYRITLGDPAAHSGIYKDIYCGNLDLWYMSDYVSGNYVFASSTKVNVDILRNIRPLAFTAYLSSPALYYKGAQTKVIVDFGEWETANDVDRRMTYKSSNPKAATVDANGMVTVVSVPKAGETAEVDITVTSVADPSLKDTVTLYIRTPSAGKAGMYIRDGGEDVSSKFNWTMLKQNGMNGTVRELVFKIADPVDGLTNMPVEFSVTGGEGLSIWTTNNENTVRRYYYGKLGSDGTVHLYLSAENAGVFTVNAVTQIGRNASITVNVDGISQKQGDIPTASSKIFIGGKTVTSWVKYNENTCSWTQSKEVFRTVDSSCEMILYADPSTKYIARNGIKKIGKKKYAFGEYGELLYYDEGSGPEKGIVNVPDAAFGSFPVMIAKTFEVLTGWQEIWGEVYYFDPDLCYPVMDAFVPRGKGMTYVNYYGRMEAYHVAEGREVPILDYDGLYKISVSGEDQYYWFRGGVIQTGWLYCHFPVETLDPYDWDKTNKEVYEKIYLDPLKGGQMAQGWFLVDGKTYNSVWNYSHLTCSIKTALSLYTDYPKKYKYFWNKNISLAMDSSGAVVTDKMVLIGVWDSDSDAFADRYIYLDEGGWKVKDTWKSINGKKFYFDSDGYLVKDAYTPSEMFVYTGEFDQEMVLISLKDPKKPTEGYTYFYHDGTAFRKLTSVMLYDEMTYQPACMLDAKGNAVVNAAATVRAKLSDTGKVTYLADREGNIVRAESSAFCRIYEANKKLYAVDEYGIVQKNSTKPFPTEIGGHYGSSMADKNGVLAKNAFRTAYDGDTYVTCKVWFDENGQAVSEGTLFFTDPFTGIGYYTVRVKDKNYLLFSMAPYTKGISLPGKTYGCSEGWQGGEDNPVYLNKDGSIKTGFVKHGAKTFYIAANEYNTAVLSNYVQNGSELPNPPDYSLYYSVLYRINGKTYFFDLMGRAVSGWMHFNQAMVIDVNDSLAGIQTDIRYIMDGYMYFSTKNFAAVTGKNKVPVPETFNGIISLGHEETFGYDELRVNASAKMDTLYFSSDGLLQYNRQVNDGGKLYHLGPDGRKTDGTAHWLSAYKNSYVLKSGELAKGRTKIEGRYYYFDPDTCLKVTNALRKTKGKWYYYGASGAQETPELGQYFDIELPDGTAGRVYFGSSHYKKLKAVWNKDGSLAKIIYTQSGKPASGESVCFGIWSTLQSDIYDILDSGLNGYVLDDKGLPKTGYVTGFTSGLTGTSRYAFNVASDGKIVNAGGMPSEFSLVKIGKKYYIQSQSGIVTGLSGIRVLSDWSTLPAADRKTMDELDISAKMMGLPLYVLVNSDGSVSVDTVFFGEQTLPSANFWDKTYVQGTWRTNRLGVVLDLITPIYRYRDKCYVSSIASLKGGKETFSLYMWKFISAYDSSEVEIEVRCDGNRITGFYEKMTGKPADGIYSSYLASSYNIIWMKKGQPQTGTRKLSVSGFSMSYYVDSSLIGTNPYAPMYRDPVILE